MEYLIKDLNGDPIYEYDRIHFELKNYCICEIMEEDCECNSFTSKIGHFEFDSEALNYKIVIPLTDEAVLNYRLSDCKNFHKEEENGLSLNSICNWH